MIWSVIKNNKDHFIITTITIVIQAVSLVLLKKGIISVFTNIPIIEANYFATLFVVSVVMPTLSMFVCTFRNTPSDGFSENDTLAENSMKGIEPIDSIIVLGGYFALSAILTYMIVQIVVV